MRASLHYYTSDPSGAAVSVRPDAMSPAALNYQDTAPDSKHAERNADRSAQQLVWILISILLLLYLATSYLFLAKIESAWPFYGGF